MGSLDGWKTLNPEEQLLRLIKDVARLNDSLRDYTKLKGIRLESRIVGGERRLYAVVDDSTASNNGVSYQIAP